MIICVVDKGFIMEKYLYFVEGSEMCNDYWKII